MVHGEVITLQLGTFSNFTCSHLWNLQANCFYYTKQAPFGHEFNHDVFYREGQNLQNKVTFNPRAVLIDLKGSTHKAAWPVDRAYDGPADEENKFWDGTMQIHKAEPLARSSKSEELGEGGGKSATSDFIIKDTWAGYLQNKFHPKTVLVSNRFDVDNPQQPFDIYSQGDELWSFEGEEFEDRIRWFAENCDRLLGFNIIADAANGFSGFTSKCLDHLADAYRGKTSVIWGLFDVPGDEKSAAYRSMNAVLGYHKMHEMADLILPLAVTTDGIGRNLRRSTIPLDLSAFTGGAVLSLHIDSILSSLKLKSDSGCDLATFSKTMAEGQRKFVVSSMITQPTKDSQVECFTPKCPTPRHSRSTFVAIRASDELQKNVAKICGSNPASTLCTSIKHPTKFLEDRFFPAASEIAMRGSGQLSGVYALYNSDAILTHFDDLLRRRFHLNKMHRLAVAKGDLDEAVYGLAGIREHYIS